MYKCALKGCLEAATSLSNQEQTTAYKDFQVCTENFLSSGALLTCLLLLQSDIVGKMWPPNKVSRQGQHFCTPAKTSSLVEVNTLNASDTQCRLEYNRAQALSVFRYSYFSLLILVAEQHAIFNERSTSCQETHYRRTHRDNAVRIICALNVNFCRQKTSKLRYITTTKYKQQICTGQNKTQCKEIEESSMISVRRVHTGEFTATEGWVR